VISITAQFTCPDGTNWECVFTAGFTCDGLPVESTIQYNCSLL
jgi:hypothetical protein